MKNIFVVALAIYFFSWFALYKTGINSLPIQSEDTIPAMFLPYAIINEHTLNLTDFYQQMVLRYPHPDDRDYVKGMTPFYLKKIGSEYVSAFPLVVPILALPVYFIPVVAGVPPTWETLILLSHLSAAMLIALSAALFFLLLHRYVVKDERKSLLLTVVYAFGTVNFAMLSQALWQHGILELVLIVNLLALYAYLAKPTLKNSFLMGLLAGLALLTRPTSAVVVGLLVIYLHIQRYVVLNSPGLVRYLKIEAKQLWFYLLGFALPVAFFIWYNTTYYLDIANQGYASQLFSEWLGKFPESFVGIWMSPSKGILVYSPVFIFSIFGAYLAVKKGLRPNLIYFFFILIILLHTLVMSFWKHWYGGFSFGYRMSSEIIPFLVLLLVPFIQSSYFEKYKKTFFALVVISILVEIYGLVFFDGIWHNAYDKGFVDTAWLWSLTDSEFAFNVRRVFVKLGMLDKACPVCMPGI